MNRKTKKISITDKMKLKPVKEINWWMIIFSIGYIAYGTWFCFFRLNINCKSMLLFATVLGISLAVAYAALIPNKNTENIENENMSDN